MLPIKHQQAAGWPVQVWAYPLPASQTASSRQRRGWNAAMLASGGRAGVGVGIPITCRSDGQQAAGVAGSGMGMPVVCRSNTSRRKKTI